MMHNVKINNHILYIKTTTNLDILAAFSNSNHKPTSIFTCRFTRKR